MSRVSDLQEKYKQSVQDFKSLLPAVALDTITTRFLLLFLFLLSIPLISVIIFSSSLLASQMDDVSSNQLALSRSLFQGVMSGSRDKLTYLNLSAPTQDCKNIPDALCLQINHATETVTANGLPLPVETLTEQAPNLVSSLRKPITEDSFFSRWGPALYLFHKNATQVDGLRESFLGLPVDTQLLSRLYRQEPSLHTEIWLLAYPNESGQPQWIARSPLHQNPIPAQDILDNLDKTDLMSQPVTMELPQGSFKVVRDPLYAPNSQQIAWVVHVLPLAQNQLVLNHYYVGIYIISVASLIFSILLAMAASRTITQPLLKLISQVNTISRENVMRDKDEVGIYGVYEIRQLGEAFNRMIKRLRQEHKMKDEFVATLTHDLKVPLLAEKQTLSYFKSSTYGPLSEEQTEVLEVLQSSNRSCLSLVNGLLEVYRYDSGEVALIFESFSLPRLLQETVNELQALAQEKAIQIELKNELTGDGEHTQVYADRLEIKRVLHNLVSNAIINTPVHGKITCSVTDAQHHGGDTVYKVGGFQHTTLKYPVKLTERLLVVIEDSGVGFSSEDLPNLFKQFAASRGRNPMSIGLGLYNCHQVIQAHHGVLWVESSEGEGAMVSFVLPQNQQAAQDRRVYRDRRKQP